LYEEGFNAHNPAVFDELWAADFVPHTPSGIPGGTGDRVGANQIIALIFSLSRLAGDA